MADAMNRWCLPQLNRKAASFASALVLTAGLAVSTASAPATANESVAAQTVEPEKDSKVILRNGTEHVGTIVSDDGRTVVIETVISNIPTTLTIERWKIRSIEEVERAPAASPSEMEQFRSRANADRDTGEPARAPVEKLKRDGYALVLEVPMEGTFGQDIYPKSIAMALEWAVERGVTDVVFRIDSGGGEVWAANKIVDIMERHQDDLRYHGLIESAISASIWPMFECDTISMAPGSDFGGAVVYTQTDTGSAEVDKKMNSIMAAKLSSSAEAKGHNPIIVKAMMLSESEVFKYRRRGTSMPWKLTDDRTIAMARDMEHEIVDSANEVLTLTAVEADSLGVASILADDSLESIATVTSLGPWDNAGNFGIDAAEEWNEKSDKLRDRISTTVTSLMFELGRMGDNMTVGSAGLIVNTGRRKLAELERYLDQAEDLEMDTIVESFDGLDLELIKDQLNRLQADIRRVRSGG